MKTEPAPGSLVTETSPPVIRQKWRVITNLSVPDVSVGVMCGLYQMKNGGDVTDVTPRREPIRDTLGRLRPGNGESTKRVRNRDNRHRGR